MRTRERNCWSRSRTRATPAPAMGRHHPEGTGTHLPEGPVQAGLGAVHDGEGHGRRSAAFSGRSNPAEDDSPRFAFVHAGRADTPSTLPAAVIRHAQPRRPPTSQPIKIVPKGLRSFDAHDADFFLELLPGPRDREGLPDSIRFWKTRIEDDRRRQHVCRGPDLWAIGLRQVVAGESGSAAPAVQRRDRRFTSRPPPRKRRPGC